MRTTLAVLALAALAACSTPSTNEGSAGAAGDVELTVDRSSNRAGEPIVLTLRNRSAQQVGYNLCGAALERRSGNSWQPAQGLAEVCTMELRTLAPNGTDTYRHMLPASLAPGQYRVHTNVEAPLGASFIVVASGSFEVN